MKYKKSSQNVSEKIKTDVRETWLLQRRDIRRFCLHSSCRIIKVSDRVQVSDNGVKGSIITQTEQSAQQRDSKRHWNAKVWGENLLAKNILVLLYWEITNIQSDEAENIPKWSRN